MLTVNFLSTSGETEEKDFMFYITPRLAPGKPIISNPHFIFENYDWEYDSMYDNTPPSEFTFDLYSENATTFELHLVMSKGDYNYFTIDDWYNGKDNGVNITYHNGWGEVADGQATYLSTNVIGKGGQDWGEIILIRGYNEYGFGVYSEPIFTTDYITDPAILERIKRLQIEAEMTTPTAEDLRIVRSGGSLVAVSDGDAVVEVEMIGIDGAKRATASGRGQAAADLTQLAPGVYVVRASDGTSVKTSKAMIND